MTAAWEWLLPQKTATFYAPLQLNDGSVIKYVDTIDGWSDDDLDKMTISKLNVVFDGSTEVPFELEVKMGHMKKRVAYA